MNEHLFPRVARSQDGWPVLDCEQLIEHVVRAVADALADNPLGFRNDLDELGETRADEPLGRLMDALLGSRHFPLDTELPISPALAAALTATLAPIAAQHTAPRSAA